MNEEICSEFSLHYKPVILSSEMFDTDTFGRSTAQLGEFETIAR